MRKLSLFILCLSFIMLSCDKSNTRDKEAAIAAIKGYTTALIEAYKDGNANYLTPFAGAEQTSFINLNILSYKTENRIFLSRLNNLKIKDVRAADSSTGELLAETEEDWVFWFQEIGTNTILVPETKIKYNVTYHMVKRGSSWIVRKLDLKVVK